MQHCRTERASGIINITLIKSDIAWMEDLGWSYTEKQLADVHWLHRKVFSWAIKSARSSWFTLEFQFVASLNKHSAQLLKQSVWFNSWKENIYSLRINRHTIYGLYFFVCIYSNPPTPSQHVVVEKSSKEMIQANKEVCVNACVCSVASSSYHPGLLFLNRKV